MFWAVVEKKVAAATTGAWVKRAPTEEKEGEGTQGSAWSSRGVVVEVLSSLSLLSV
jgi:hypothetical protein